jgi:hypothetical protein
MRIDKKQQISKAGQGAAFGHFEREGIENGSL